MYCIVLLHSSTLCQRSLKYVHVHVCVCVLLRNTLISLLELWDFGCSGMQSLATLTQGGWERNRTTSSGSLG